MAQNQSITSNISYSDINNDNKNNNQKAKLRVAVMGSYPYAFCEEVIIKDISGKEEKNDTEDNKKYNINGIAVKIWEETARKYNIDYEYICIDLTNSTYDNFLIDLNNDKYDVALGGFSMLPRRLDLALFTRPYFISEIDIFSKHNKSLLEGFITNKLLFLLFFIFFAIIFIFAYIHSYIERTNYIDSIVRVYKEFFTNEIIFINDKNSYINKFINLFWSFTRFFFFAIIITQLISLIVITNKQVISKEEIDKIKELNVLEGTSYVDIVEKMGKKPILNKNVEEIKQKLSNSNGDVYWLVELQYGVKELSKSNIDYNKSEKIVYAEEITIAVNKKYPDLVEKLDLTIVGLQDSGEMLKICKGYLPDRFDACLL